MFRKIEIFIFLSFLFTNLSFAQDSVLIKANSKSIIRISENGYRLYPYNKKRVHLVTAGTIVGYAATLAWLSHSWYSQYPKSRFHFHNDDKEWLQMDKVGHAYGTYTESLINNGLWRWSGLPWKQRIWLSGLTAVAFQTIIETLDGFSSIYGWSWGDFSADMAGFSLFITQELAWNDQRIKLKFSFHRKNYVQADLTARADAIFGKSEAERFFKDYNGMTDWVSVNIPSFFPGLNLPKWLSLSVGYGAEGMFGPVNNIDINKNGVVIFDRSDIQRYRQWYLSPDIDLTKIRTHKKVLRFLFGVFNSFKFPAPALEFSRGNFKFHWLHF